MIVHLRTLDETLATAWRTMFTAPGVTVAVGDILATTADAIVSPANSFGYMDGGIDLAYVQRFGVAVEDALQERIASECDGELPVGQALVVPTGDVHIPWLVSAPTMRVPATIDDTVNVWLAFRAALLAVRRHNATAATPIRSLSSPALGAGIGAMPFHRVARQMHAAWADVVLGDHAWRANARSVLAHHAGLLR